MKDTFHKPVLCCNSWHIATHLALCNKVLNQGGSYHHNTAPSLNSDLLSNFTIFPINYHHGRTEAKKSLWLRVIKFSSIYPASTYVNVKKTVPDLDCFISKPKPKQIWLQKCTDYLYEQQFNCERVSSSNVRLPRHRKRSLRMTASIYTGYSSRPCVPSSSVSARAGVFTYGASEVWRTAQCPCVFWGSLCQWPSQSTLHTDTL